MERLEKKEEIKISVRELIVFILRSGDLSSGFRGNSRALEGTKAHQKLQQSRDEKKYQSEITLSYSQEYKDYTIIISGRADGVIKEKNKIIIEEIKSTNLALDMIQEDYKQIHWGQLILYAYFYAKEYSMEEITTQLTYYQIETEGIKEFQRHYLLEDLEEFFQDIMDKYTYWLDFKSSWREKRDRSIEVLDFPFSSYRNGQRKLAIAVYKTIMDNKKLYVEAATGIGKTISTIFPAIKALGEKHLEKIFYLTAKTVTKQVAEETILALADKGLNLKAITITAKEKICFQEERNCDPEYCSYAKGHFDRINQGLKEILQNENIIYRELIEKYAEKHHICPFEFSLDITNHADFIICDYNYVFDPRVALKRFFAEEGGDYLFLIDEAHNLVDRARDMFSAELYLSNFLQLKSQLQEERVNLLNKQVISYLTRIISFLFNYNSEIEEKKREEDFILQEELVLELYPILNGFINKVEEWLLENNDSNIANQKSSLYQLLLDTYFNVLAFLRIMDIYDNNFITYYQQEEKKIEQCYNIELQKDLFSNANGELVKEASNKDLRVKLFCLDPAKNLKEVVKKGKASIFFSATLSPLDYYQAILAGEDDYYLQLPSPFDRKNLCLLLADNISTKYRERESGYDKIVDYIDSVISCKKGNYLVFFPSYAYMEAIHELYKEKYPGINTIVQSRGMNDYDRYDFLKSFDSNTDNYLAFAVTGGIFSEGIDLKGKKLIGTIVVGIAHPRITLERNLIRDYFQAKVNKGYEYAYIYPGVNKILQAAGRTIRSSTDRGVVFLIGQRYENYRYSNLLPQYWHQIKRKVNSSNAISNILNDFWNH